MDYNNFLKNKVKTEKISGVNNIPHLPYQLFDSQKAVTEWALKRGRAAIFAGTGMGKSFIELSWAKAISESEKKPVLIFTPLAVAQQMQNEAGKFGIDSDVVQNSEQSKNLIQITNYQKIDHFDLSKYIGVVLDESSIIKNESGHFRNKLIKECKKCHYRLPATATPSPNDYMELGNHAEFCGIMSYTDMLSTFFTHDGGSTQKWRLKGHAESKFWEWMSTWSVMYQSPADIGFEKEGELYNLPKLHRLQHIVKADHKSLNDAGMLFAMQAETLKERLNARRATIKERVNKTIDIINSIDKSDPIVIWCNLNDESKMITQKLDDAVELTGSMPDTKKEKILDDFSNGRIRILVTKPSICGFGMNWQFCNQTIFIGLNDSFEQIYQAIRRFWRFGQKREVYAHFIASELEGAVVSNIARKEKQANHMMDQMIIHMKKFTVENIKGASRETTDYQPNENINLPNWI